MSHFLVVIVAKMKIWNIWCDNDNEKYGSSFYRNASLAMMVYAIDNKESFNHIETWLKEVKLQSNPDIKIFLIGNKSDLDENRQVELERAKKFTEENGIHYFSETSAKAGINAKEVFIEAAKLLYGEHLKYKVRNVKKLDSEKDKIPIPIKVTKDKKNTRKKGGCCAS